MVDPITEADLAAYIDGELDAWRRLDVEAHLAKNPEDAARVMADLRDRDALREALSIIPGSEPERLRDGARRIDRAFAWSRVGARLRRAAVIALLVGAGWIAHSDFGSFGVPGTFASPVDPALVEEARLAHEAALIRARTTSQRAISSYDRADLETATGLKLPAMPADWTVRDVQVFPSRNGTGIEVEIDAGPLGALALFAMGSNAQVPNAEAMQAPEGKAIYWQRGTTAFALSGGRDAVVLRAASAKLMATLR